MGNVVIILDPSALDPRKPGKKPGFGSTPPSLFFLLEKSRKCGI